MYQTIVVGTDGSEQATDAVRRAGQLAASGDGATVHVVTASRTYSPEALELLQRDVPGELHDVIGPYLDSAACLAKARAVLRPMKVKIAEHDVGGDAAAALLQTAETVGADLIVVGARGLGAVARFLRGSVSTRVVHHAECDVLVVEHDD